MIIESKEIEGATFLTLTNRAGLKITLSDYGAGIYFISFNGVPLTVGEQSHKAWLHSDSYFGKTVGRLAGRLQDGKLDYLGKLYQIPANEGKNTLHGGPEGFSFLKFRLDVSHLGEDVAADFYLLSPAGAMGFPGEVSLRVRYLISESEPSFRIIYEAKSTEETPLNLTNHTYWNLGGTMNVEGELLYIDASKAMTYSQDLIPQGFQDVTSPLDFRIPKPIGKDISDPSLYETRTKGYDHCYLFDENDGIKDVAVLRGKTVELHIQTSLPALQFYSTNYFTEGLELSNGRKIALHAGAALEAVKAPGDFHSMAVLPFETKKDFVAYSFKELKL